MLQRFFDWFDDAASRVLRIAYLVPFVIATALYFGGQVPGFVENFLGGGLPWILAFAVEMQTYVSVRKLAVIYNGLKADTLEPEQRKRMVKDAWVQSATVAVLSGFSIWNQASYLAENWHPTASAFGAPLWLDIAIRSVGPAAFFFLTSFGAPMAKTIGEKLAEEAHKTLDSFVDVLTNQRKRAIKKVDGKVLDMTDAIQTVAAAANERRNGVVLASVQGAITRLASLEPGQVVIESATPPPPIPLRNTGSLLEQCRMVYQFGMAPQELAAKVGCSVKTARRHIATLTNESFAMSRREA